MPAIMGYFKSDSIPIAKMTSPVLEATDIALGCFSLSSSLVATCAVLASPEKNLSKSMLRIAQVN
jgi:hypothetical protein